MEYTEKSSDRTGEKVKRYFKRGIIALLLSVLVVIPVSGIALADENTIDMVVSPNVLNLESNGGSISIHTDVGYVIPPGAFQADVTLEVNGVTVEKVVTFPDMSGNLVVKADIDTIKEIITVEGEATFYLTYNDTHTTYTDDDTIKVIKVIPQRP